MTTTALSLPVLDLSRLDAGGADAAAFCTELREAAHDYGFFYLVGHGVPEELSRQLITVARQFFDLPEADKLAIENIKSPHFRGYTRVGGELTRGVVDWREQIDVGPEREAVERGVDVPDYFRLQGPNQWPAALPALREIVSEWHDELSVVALRLMRAWALSLGADEHVFDPAFADKPANLIKIVRYPGRSDREPRQGVGAHKDSGVLTLLFVEPGKGGLQVQNRIHRGAVQPAAEDEWIDAPPIDGAFVVNTGELLEYATDGYLEATLHRVISPRLGEDRISIPFFFSPALDSAIPRLTLPGNLDRPGVTLDPANPIFSTYGQNALKSRLRAHPDVAAIHHPDLVS